MLRGLLILGALISNAYAEEASSVLSKVDSAMSASTDLLIRYEVTNQDPGKKNTEQMEFTTRVQGEKSLTEFHKPGDLKDTRILVTSREVLYIWSPSLPRVRRVASHATEQGFMGTTYSHADMSSAPLGDIYQATKLVGEADTSWQIELGPKPEQETPYAKVLLTVDKKTNQPIELKYFNDKDVNVKTETRSDFVCEGEICVPGLLRMVDHVRAGAWTEMKRQDYKINPGFDKSVFTTRVLPIGVSN